MGVVKRSGSRRNPWSQRKAKNMVVGSQGKVQVQLRGYVEIHDQEHEGMHGKKKASIEKVGVQKRFQEG